MRKNREAGSILTIAVVMLVFVAALTFAMVALAQNDRAVAGTKLARVGSRCEAESATQYAIKYLADQAAQGSPVTGTVSGTVVIRGDTVNYTIVKTGTDVVVTAPDGVTETLQTYQVSAIGTARPSAGSTGSLATTTCNRLVVMGTIPVFQFAVFYGVPLEIDPGANMTINGRVQSNSDLYVSPSAALTFNTGWVHAAGDTYRTRGDGVFQSGAVDIQVDGAAPGTYAGWTTNGNGTQNTTADPNFAAWSATTGLPGNTQTLEDKNTGATALTVPSFKDASIGGYYDTQASLEIKTDASGQPHAFQGGVDVTSSLPAGTIANSTFFDQRAGTVVTVTDIDISLLRTTSQYPASGANNGLIYAARGDATTATPNGIRLKNASDISSAVADNGKGLTVVSPDPVYVKGDFNNPANGANERPASVLGDALYLQSNAWSDPANQSARGGGNGPAASNTTYNLAYVAGNTPSTGPNGYGGGLENFPRFLEDWSGGKTCTIKGSQCCFQNSQIDTSLWSGAAGSQQHVYSPPVRDWSFDTSFLNPSKLPPFTPRAVRVVQNVYWIAQ
jgi:hypothetical protein